MPSIRQRVLGGLAAALAAGGALLAAAAPASAGGVPAPDSSGGPGGAEYGAPLAPPGRPVASRFRVSPERVVAGAALPAIALRLDEPGVARVRARIVLWPVGRGGRLVRLDLGRVRTGRTLRPAWPKGTVLSPGRYVARVHASDAAGRPLLRPRRASGRSALVVAPPARTPAAPTRSSKGAAPAGSTSTPAPTSSTSAPAPATTSRPATPAPTPRPAAVPAPAPLTAVVASGVPGTFPVAGAHTYGDGFGVDRGTHRHEGVDVLAAQGTPIVAPTAGTVRFVDYQAAGAGEYVVLRLASGADLFLAHCVRRSTAVLPGQAVVQRQPLCAVGMTGDATTPHLHIELWPHGWRTGAKDSVPVDPMPQLRAWEG